MDNQQLLQGLRRGDAKTVRHLYDKYHAAIVHLVETNHGTAEDAEDIFQEALAVIFEKSKQPDFTIERAFLTYLYTVARNLWLNRLRKRSGKEVTSDDKMLLMVADETEQAWEHSEEYYLYQQMFLKLGKDCQQVLQLFLAKVSMESIAKKMGYGSVSYAKKRKFLCKEALVKLIQADPRYRELHQP